MKYVILLILLIAPANAQTAHKYLIFPNQAACIAYAQGRWDCSTGPLKAGTITGMVISEGSFAMRLDWGKYQVLPSTDQAKLVTGAALAPLAAAGVTVVP